MLQSAPTSTTETLFHATGAATPRCTALRSRIDALAADGHNGMAAAFHSRVLLLRYCPAAPRHL
jgi:hypothetical protein